MFESIHERGLAARTLAQAQPRPLKAAVGAVAVPPSGGLEGARRLAERRLARPELLVVDSSYRSPDALLEATEAMPTVRAPRSGGASALALSLHGQRVSSLHMLCGGVPYALLLGGEVIDPRAENARVQAAITGLRSLFLPNGHEGGAPTLMLYGTTFGTGDEGTDAVQALADALGVAVAATSDRLENAADRPEWHAKARPVVVETVRTETVAPTATSPIEDDPIARLRHRAEKHRAARAQAKQRVAPAAEPKSKNALLPAPPPSAPPKIEREPERDIEDRLQQTFAELRRRVIDKRSTQSSTQKTERKAPIAPTARAEPVRAPAVVEPKRSRIVRHRADGSPIDGSPSEGQGDVEITPRTAAAPAETFDPIMVVDPFADPMSALHALRASEARADLETHEPHAGERDAAAAATTSKEPETIEPKRTDAPETAEPVRDNSGPAGCASTETVQHNAQRVDQPTSGSASASRKTPDAHDPGGPLQAFSVEAIVRPKPFVRDDTIEIGEDITIEFDGPRVCFAVAWDTRIVTATADLTVLGIDEPSRSPVHLLGTVGGGWASLFVEGALAASVPLRGAGDGRAWPVAERAPSLEKFEGEVSLLRLVPHAIDAGDADALCRATRAGEYGSDHRWVAGSLASKVGEGCAQSAPKSAPVVANSSRTPIDTVPREAEPKPASVASPPESEGTLAAGGQQTDASGKPGLPVSSSLSAPPAPSAPAEAAPVGNEHTKPITEAASASSALGAERRVVPGEALALDLPALGGCELADVVRAWPVTMPDWLKLDPLEGIAHGRVPRDHRPGTIALVVTSANDRGSTATVAVTLRIEG